MFRIEGLTEFGTGYFWSIKNTTNTGYTKTIRYTTDQYGHGLYKDEETDRRLITNQFSLSSNNPGRAKQQIREYFQQIL